MANRISHRYNHLPLLPSGPGGIQRELVVPICRCKVRERKRQLKRLVKLKLGSSGFFA